jgi:hypothetical protein
MKARPQPLAATLTVAAKTLAEVKKLGHTLKLDSALMEHAVLARWARPRWLLDWTSCCPSSRWTAPLIEARLKLTRLRDHLILME